MGLSNFKIIKQQVVSKKPYNDVPLVQIQLCFRFKTSILTVHQLLNEVGIRCISVMEALP
jgi:hypothetical protein